MSFSVNFCCVHYCFWVQICEGIVIPNVSFREDDEEAFEGNYVEYIRKDLEGSDTDTRRRAACDFIRTLADRFPSETTEIVNSYIAQHWSMKDCALHMVMALAVKGKTAAAGATSVNELVNVERFFEEHVVPELSTSDVNERPVLKADGLRWASSSLCDHM
jgi:exportin-2 (importin alpha re-exporter)